MRRKSHQIRSNFARSDQNLIGFDEISPYPVKISPDLREITPESGKISLESGFFSPEFGKFWSEYGFFHWILENFGWNLEIYWSVRVFWVLREENRNPIRWNRFLVMKTCHRPTGVVKLDPVGSSGGSGTRMNLDSLMNTDKEMVKF